MGVTINRTSSTSITNQIQKIGNKLAKSSERLATGKRINKAYDDVVGLLKAASLTSAINETETNIRVKEQALSDLANSESGLFQNLERLQNLRELAVQASDDSIDSNTRQALNNQVNETLQAYGSGAPSINVGTSTDAQTSLTTLDTSIENLASRLASIGSQEQNLENQIQDEQQKNENLQAARSAVEDVDIAAEMADQIKLKFTHSALLRVLETSNKMQKETVLKLIA